MFWFFNLHVYGRDEGVASAESNVFNEGPLLSTGGDCDLQIYA